MCRKIKKDAGTIDFGRPAEEILRLVRAMSPWPSAFTFLPNGRRLAILQAKSVLAPGTTNAPGEIIASKQFVVACGSGAIELQTIKPEGKGPMGGDAFLRGTQLAPGDLLGPEQKS